MNAVIWALITAGIWGVVPLLEKAGLAKVEPLTGLFYRCLGVVAGLIVLGTAVLKPEQIKAVDIRSASLLVVGGFLASFAAQLAFYHSLKIGQMSWVVPLSGSYPLVAFILGVVFLGETVTLSKAAGMLLIVAGIWFLKTG